MCRLIQVIVLVLLCWVHWSEPAAANDKHVRLATLAWEPYVGQSLEGNGYIAEIVREAYRRSGYTVDVVFYPWARAVKVAEIGAADGLFPEYWDEGRKEKFAFSNPFPGGPVGLYKRKDLAVSYSVDPRINQTEALRGLKEYRFGVVRGYINTAEFDAADFLDKEEVFSDELNIKILHKKRIHFMFIDKLVAEHLIHTKFPQFEADLEFMEPPFENKQLYIAFSKQAEGWQEKMAAFNAGLAAITDDGTMTRIMEHHGFSRLLLED